MASVTVIPINIYKNITDIKNVVKTFLNKEIVLYWAMEWCEWCA